MHYTIENEETMRRADEQQLIEYLAYTVIAQTAPDELPVFQATSAAYFANPREVLTPAEEKDEKLGFGLAETSSLLTPIVLFITQEAITMVTAGVSHAAEEEGKGLLSTLIKKVFKGRQQQQQNSQQSISPLTADQLMLIRTQAYQTARKLKTPDQTALLLADALIGSLVNSSAIPVNASDNAK